LSPVTVWLIQASMSHVTIQTASEDNGAEARDCKLYSSLTKMYTHIKTSYLPLNQISVVWSRIGVYLLSNTTIWWIYIYIYYLLHR
jgi:hypothetical protein